MGTRKCAIDDCNRLEFRVSGFCLKHKDGIPISIEVNTSNLPQFESEETSTIRLQRTNEIDLANNVKKKKDAAFSATSAVVLFITGILFYHNDEKFVGECCGFFSLALGFWFLILFLVYSAGISKNIELTKS